MISIMLSKKYLNTLKSTPVLMTHFMDQSIQSPILQKQMQLWQTITDSYSLPISHVRTCTLMNDVNPVGDWLRPGMMLYGLPSHSQWQLKQAITLKAVYQVYGVKAGEYIGYDYTHCFKKDGLPLLLLGTVMGFLWILRNQQSYLLMVQVYQ